ncbi:hypothetical protein [Shinella zoogloeoides]|uniref:hypothetical protein n=1 Tax=Shinella zoogloeoides TaxID=352475 RepID=UPI00273E19D4|nr:hypothetical protein [Shinella zoogloeoides]WLR91011.1 hypothetical protein Q9316_00250 [Shinella zoogloeoides]
MTNRVVLGKLNGSMAARVSKPGIDVLTASALEDFFLHESFKGHRILQTGSIPFATNTTTCTIYYPDWGFVPIIFMVPAASDTAVYPFLSGGNLVGVWNIEQEPTRTSCVFTIQTPLQSSLYVRYVILPLVN